MAKKDAAARSKPSQQQAPPAKRQRREDSQSNNDTPSSSSAPQSSSASAAPISLKNNLFLSCFWSLSATDPKQRISAQKTLLKLLQRQQLQYATQTRNRESRETDTEEEEQLAATISRDEQRQTEEEKKVEEREIQLLDENAIVTATPADRHAPSLAPNVRYALHRLLRGLCGTGDTVKKGFSLALTALLTHFPVISHSHIKSTMERALALPSSPAKTEITDFKLGHAVAINVLCAADRIQAHDTETELLPIIRKLLQDSNNRSVREQAYLAVSQILTKITFSDYQQHVENILLADLATTKRALKEEQAEAEEEEGQESSSTNADNESTVSLDALWPEQVQMLLTMQRLYQQHHLSPSHLGKSKLAHSTRHPLSASSLPALVQTLAHATHALPHLHSVWTTLFDPLLQVQSNDPSSTDKHHHSWRTVWQTCDEYLFSQKASTARKHMGLLLFVHLFKTILHNTYPTVADKNNQLTALFTPAFLRTWINSLASKQTHLYEVAHSIQHQLCHLLTMPQHTENILSVVTVLITPFPRFDSITKTKTIQTLIQALDAQGVMVYIHQLVSMFQQQPSSPPSSSSTSLDEQQVSKEESRESDQLWVLEQFYTVSKTVALLGKKNDQEQQQNEAIEIILKFFLFYGFFNCTQTAQQQHNAQDKLVGKKNSSKKKAKPVEEDQSSIQNDKTVTVLLHASLSARVREVCQTRFWSLLDDLLPNKTQPNKHGNNPSKQSGKKAKALTESEVRGDQESDMHDDAPHAHDHEAAVDQADDVIPSHSLWSLKAHQYWDVLEQQGYQLASPLNKEARTARTSMLAIVQGLQESSTNRMKDIKEQTDKQQLKALHRKEHALALLLLHLGFLQLSDTEEATSFLQELELAYRQVFYSAREQQAQQQKQQPKKKSNKKQQIIHDEEEADQQPQPVFVEVLVDILLSLLVRPSLLFRDLGKHVFAAFTADVNENVLEDMLRILNRRSRDATKKHSEEDGEDDDDFQPIDVDEDEDDEGEEEEEPDIQKAAAKPQRSTRSHTAATAATIPKTKSKATTAATTAPAPAVEDEEESEDELVDIDSLSDLLLTPLTPAEESAVANAASSSSGFDPYDHHLANLIKLRQENNKAAQQDLLLQTINFQSRVCDLMEIYIRQESDQVLCITVLLLGLLSAVQSTRKGEQLRALHEKLAGLVKKIIRSKTHPTVRYTNASADGSARGSDSGDENKGRSSVFLIGDVQQVMKTLMQKAQKAKNQNEMVSLISAALLYLIRISLPTNTLISTAAQEQLSSQQAAHLQFVYELYRDALISYLTIRHSHLNTKFFSDFFQTAPAIAWKMAPTLAQISITPLTTTAAITATTMTSSKQKKKGAASANGVNATPSYTGPYAATAFLRNDCFLLLDALFMRKSFIAVQNRDQVAAVIQGVSQSLESALIYASSPHPHKDEQTEQAQTELSASTQGVGTADDSTATDKTDMSKLSAKERWKLKLKEKKKRKKLRSQEEARKKREGEAMNTESTAIDTEKQQQQHWKAISHRIKTMIHTAQTVTSAIKKINSHQTEATHTLEKGAVKPVVDARVLLALSGLPVPLVTSLRASLLQLCTACDLPLFESLSAVNTQEAQKQREQKAAKAAKAAKEKTAQSDKQQKNKKRKVRERDGESAEGDESARAAARAALASAALRQRMNGDQRHRKQGNQNKGPKKPKSDEEIQPAARHSQLNKEKPPLGNKSLNANGAKRTLPSEAESTSASKRTKVVG